MPHDPDRTVTDLDRLAAAIRACTLCRDAPRGRPLPHEPRPVANLSATARILVAGQAPGTKVHASGLPFDDASGDRLRAWMGLDVATFYDTTRLAFLPMGFCFPGQDAAGGDLPPRRECAPRWRAAAIAAMPQVELVLAIGAHAQAWHLGSLARRSMTETVADWRTVMAATARPTVVPLPHPSWRNTGWIRRHPWFEAELLPVLKAEIAARVGPMRE